MLEEMYNAKITMHKYFKGRISGVLSDWYLCLTKCIASLVSWFVLSGPTVFSMVQSQNEKKPEICLGI